MKNCPNCNAVLADEAVFCTNCGTSVQGAAPQPNPQPNPQPAPYAQPAPAVPSTDHTAQFSAQDVSENKLFALLAYAMSVIGVVIALVANINNKSEYLKFHIKQSLKIFVTELMVAFLTAVLCWTCIVPIAGAVSAVILVVLTVICFIQTCRNKSVEVPILSSFGFLK